MPDFPPVEPRPARRFTETERQALHDIIAERRDVRDEFLPDPVDPEALRRCSRPRTARPRWASCSRGTSSLIRDAARRAEVHKAFRRANDEAALLFPEEKRDTYRALKLQGILKAPLNICVTCDRDRCGEVVLGRTHNPEMDLYSTVCAVQNLWLAARAEGLGVGWVSIYREGGAAGDPRHPRARQDRGLSLRGPCGPLLQRAGTGLEGLASAAAARRSAHGGRLAGRPRFVRAQAGAASALDGRSGVERLSRALGAGVCLGLTGLSEGASCRAGRVRNRRPRLQ